MRPCSDVLVISEIGKILDILLLGAKSCDLTIHDKGRPTVSLKNFDLRDVEVR